MKKFLLFLFMITLILSCKNTKPNSTDVVDSVAVKEQKLLNKLDTIISNDSIKKIKVDTIKTKK